MIVIIEIKVEDGVLALCMFLILQYIGHIFVTIGDHPDELGNQIIEVFKRVRTADGALLGARFSGFRQDLLNHRWATLSRSSPLFLIRTRN
jgi:hypothetical protein